MPLGAFKDCFKLYIQRLFLSASKIGGREKVRKRAEFASIFCQQTMPANDASKLENGKYETKSDKILGTYIYILFKKEYIYKGCKNFPELTLNLIGVKFNLPLRWSMCRRL